MYDVIGWGRKGQPRGYANEYQSYPQMMIIAVTAGGLRVTSGAVQKVVRMGSALILPPGAAFKLDTARGKYAGHYVEADPGDVSLSPVPRVLTLPEHCQRLIAAIEAEYRTAADARVLAASYELWYRYTLREVSSQQDDLVTRIDRLLAAAVCTPATVGEILQDLPCSERHARRLYQKQHGFSPKEALLRYKLTAAAQMLAQTSLPVLTIALDLGFPSSQHFATVFKRHHHCTPSQWRQRQQS